MLLQLVGLIIKKLIHLTMYRVVSFPTDILQQKDLITLAALEPLFFAGSCALFPRTGSGDGMRSTKRAATNF